MQGRDREERRAHARYAIAFFAFTVLAVGGCVGLNYFIDPYGIHGAPRVSGLNARKPAVGMNLRMMKAHAVRALKPKALVLGSSRADYALDPAHPGWATEPVYNLSLYAVNAYELLRYFQHANAIQPVEQIVLALDFYMFNGYSSPRPDFDEGRLAANAEGEAQEDTSSDVRITLASLDALAASFNTVRKQGGKSVVHLDNGFRHSEQDWVRVRRRGGHRRTFLGSEQRYMRFTWFPAPENRFAFAREDGSNSMLAPLRTLLATCYRQGTDVRILISPSHARHWEALAEVGLWDTFEDWKRQLVALNAEEAERAGKTAYGVWDFSGYSGLTTEDVPALGDTDTEMAWFWESSHYKKELGDLVLDRVFGTSSPDRPLPADFGVRIDGSNLEAHLAATRAARDVWRATHLDDVADIERLAAESLAYRTPPAREDD